MLLSHMLEVLYEPLVKVLQIRLWTSCTTKVTYLATPAIIFYDGSEDELFDYNCHSIFRLLICRENVASFFLSLSKQAL